MWRMPFHCFHLLYTTFSPTFYSAFQHCTEILLQCLWPQLKHLQLDWNPVIGLKCFQLESFGFEIHFRCSKIRHLLGCLRLLWCHHLISNSIRFQTFFGVSEKYFKCCSFLTTDPCAVFTYGSDVIANSTPIKFCGQSVNSFFFLF